MPSRRRNSRSTDTKARTVSASGSASRRGLDVRPHRPEPVSFHHDVWVLVTGGVETTATDGGAGGRPGRVRRRGCRRSCCCGRLCVGRLDRCDLALAPLQLDAVDVPAVLHNTPDADALAMHLCLPGLQRDEATIQRLRRLCSPRPGADGRPGDEEDDEAERDGVEPRDVVEVIAGLGLAVFVLGLVPVVLAARRLERRRRCRLTAPGSTTAMSPRSLDGRRGSVSRAASGARAASSSGLGAARPPVRSSSAFRAANCSAETAAAAGSPACRETWSSGRQALLRRLRRQGDRRGERRARTSSGAPFLGDSPDRRRRSS